MDAEPAADREGHAGPGHHAQPAAGALRAVDGRALIAAPAANGPPPAWPHLLVVAGLSAATLAFEVLLLRVFGYSHWHHFAHLAVALALLGLGAAGTVLALAGPRPAVLGDGWLLGGMLATAAGIALVIAVHAHVALRPLLAGWNAGELARLLLVDVAAFAPFFAAGLALGHGFLRWPAHPRRVYAANLLGSGAGSAAASLGLVVAQVETVLALTAAALALLALAFAAWLRRPVAIAVAAAVALALALLASAPPAPAVSDFKPLSRLLELPDAQVLAVEPGLRGRLTVVRSDSVRVAPGLSLQWPSAVPPADAVVVGSERVVTLPRTWPGPGEHHVASLSGLALALRPGADVLAVGSGTWGPTGAHGAARLTWLEPDARILALARDRGATGVGIRGIAGDAWPHLAAGGERYDVIALDGAHDGGDAVSEAYLLTAEGLALAIARLRPAGLLAVPLALEHPPRHYPRVLATLRDALLRHGAREPGAHVAVLRGLRAVLVLASPQPLATTDTAALRAFAAQWSFDLAWLPGLAREEANRHHVLDSPAFFDTSRAVFHGGALPAGSERFARGAASVDRPYVWRSLRWLQAPALLRDLGLRGASLLDWTLLLSAAAGVVVAVLAFALIVAPLGRLPRAAGTPGRAATLACFAALGLGYMLLEMAVFQRAVLFVGEPVLAASLVFAAFLVGSGVGAATAPCSARVRTVATVYGAVAATAALAVSVLWGAPQAIAALPDAARYAALAVLVLPLAFALGRPFPWALQRLAGAGRWIPWAWGINGFASVLGASAAPLLSVQAGQPASVFAAAVCYAVAAGVALRWAVHGTRAPPLRMQD